MKNKITDLNNHLFAQLERLSDEEINAEELDKEIKRSKAITDVAKNIIESNKTTIEAMKIMERAGIDVTKMNLGLLSAENVNSKTR